MWAEFVGHVDEETAGGAGHGVARLCGGTEQQVETAVEASRDADGLLAVGGGSAIDTAKAVSARRDLPVVSVPTTYSGAELTPFFGMTDPHTRQKSGAGGPTSAPMAAVYDPELTLGTPPRVSAETGLNALAHCVDEYLSRRAGQAADAGVFQGQ